MMMKGGGWPWGNQFCQVAVLGGEAAAKQGWRGRESALAEPARLMRHGGAESSGGLQRMATMTRATTMMMMRGAARCRLVAHYMVDRSTQSRRGVCHEIKKQNERITERLKLIKPGQNVWNAKLPQRLKLNVKNTKMSQIYKRLDPNKPSYTITGSGGGGTHGYHYKEPRALTNRERARIQTFPDSFNFIGNSESIRRQIGMAVPPQGIKIIFDSIIKTFSNVNYSSIPANIKDFNQPNLI